MKHRILTGAVVIPLLIVLTTTPAYAIFGSILAGIQRAQMIINQGVQIYEAQIAKLTMDTQLTELTDQFSHLKDQALGASARSPIRSPTWHRCRRSFSAWAYRGKATLPAWRRSLRRQSNRWAKPARALPNPGAGGSPPPTR